MSTSMISPLWKFENLLSRLFIDRLSKTQLIQIFDRASYYILELNPSAVAL